MIQTQNSARMLANKLVQQFAEEHSQTIKHNRLKGEIGIVLAKELDHLRNIYIEQVSPEITNSTKFLNMTIIRIVFQKHWTETSVNHFINNTTGNEVYIEEQYDANIELHTGKYEVNTYFNDGGYWDTLEICNTYKEAEQKLKCFIDLNPEW